MALRLFRVLGGDLASRTLLSIGDSGPVAPPGFVILTRPDGTILTRADGTIFVRSVA